MAKLKTSLLTKITLIFACLCLVFGVTYTIARYSSSNNGNGDADIDPFVVDAKLYDSDGIQVTDLSTTTYNLEDYTATYYLVVYNYCDFNVFYEVSIGEPFIFSADTITSGNVAVGDPYGYVVIPLYISVDPDANLDSYKENNSIPINIGVDVTQGEIEEEVLDPHALTNRTIMTCEWDLEYYYLAENITTSSAVTINSGNDIDLYLNGYTLSSTYSDYIITISSGSLTLANGGTVEGYDGYDLTLSGSGIITNTYGGGINILDGAAFSMSNQSIVSCLTKGVNVNTGATFTISEAPVIDNTNTVGVYLCNGAEITLGDGLASGADIAIDLENKYDYARVTTIEMDTDNAYAYDALKYINIDDVNYETTVNWDSYDNWTTGGGVCIQIINFIPINLSVAVQNSGNNREDIHFYTDAGNDIRGWEGEETGYAFTMNANEDKDATNQLSQYDYYYDFGTINRREDYGFCISVNQEHDKIQEWGLAPGDDIWVIDDDGEGNIGYEFNFWGSRFDGQWTKLSEWGFNFGSLSEDDKTIIHENCELLVVLLCDFNDIDPTGDFTDWDKREGSYNNVVNDYYFIVDGTTRYNRGTH